MQEDLPGLPRRDGPLFEVISISAGLRGLQVLIAPDDYIRVTDAKLAPIAKDKE